MKLEKIDRVVINRIVGVKHLYFVLDYDGTLTPIVNQPSLAKLASNTREILKELSKLPAVKVAIVSGRSLNDLELLVGIDGLDYVGNHGLERKIQGSVSVDPYAARFRELVEVVTGEFSRAMKEVPGVMVENKTYSVSVHHRNVVPKNIPKVRRIFQKVWNDSQVKIFFMVRPGKKVWEVRPSYGCSDKGKTVELLRQSLSKTEREDTAIICIGDDQTDEDAFKVLRDSDFTVKVGYGTQTHARYWLKSPGEVAAFLKKIIKTRQRVFPKNV